MPASPPARPPFAALAVACAVGAAGCALAPSRWVNDRTAPPSAVAREAAKAPSPSPVAPASREAGAAGRDAGPLRPPRSLADLVDLALSRDPATRASWRDARAAAATVGATLTWVLLDLGARGALVEEGDRLLLAARLAEQAAVGDLVLTVQVTWFQHLAARALLDAETAALKQAEASLAAAEGRQRAGLATVADILQARTALAQVRLVQQQTEGQALATRGALATLAGLPPSAELEVGILPETVDAAAVQPAVDDLLAAALARSPDVGRAAAAAAAADARARAASRAMWPVLSFQTSASRSFYLDPSGYAPVDAWSFGLVLRLPTLDSVRPAYEALAAREVAQAARDRAEATSQRVALDVWTSWQGLRTASRRVATARELLSSARASADVAGGRYREGVGSVVDLLTAQSALEVARAEDVRARADFLVGLARLARATGRIDLPAEPTSSTPEGPKAP